MTERRTLITLLAERSTKRGKFTLASGKESNYYIDARLTTMSPEGLSIIGPLALSTLHDSGWVVDSIGGLTIGADPISYAISYASVRAKFGRGEVRVLDANGSALDIIRLDGSTRIYD